MKLVKIEINEDGNKVFDPKWHYIQDWGDVEGTLCSGEVFGYGEGHAKYKTKEVVKGGITCRNCLAIIMEIKAVKL